MSKYIADPKATYKQCSRCHQHMPETAFYKDKTAKTGLSSKCKECFKEYNAERYSDPATQETLKKRCAKYYKKVVKPRVKAEKRAKKKAAAKKRAAAKAKRNNK